MPKQNTGRPHGVRLTKRQVESTRAKIRGTLIAKRVEAFLLGEKVTFAGTKTPRKVILTRDQLKAAEMLLKRSIPEITRIEHTGKDGGPIRHGTADELTDDELAAIATGRGAAPAEPEDGED